MGLQVQAAQDRPDPRELELLAQDQPELDRLAQVTRAVPAAQELEDLEVPALELSKILWSRPPM